MTNEKITIEKNKYSKIYTDLIFATDDLKQMLSDDELNKRSFIRKVDTLKDYMNFLEELEKLMKDREFREFIKAYPTTPKIEF